MADFSGKMAEQLADHLPKPFRIESMQSSMQNNSITVMITNQPPKPSE